ncbi:MAG: ATPase, T2SS/T4P/T4SS family, partial [Bdellovibrionaceae bacterium]|nr:ATPase, T2SS/T4P/T4SS family [Pseudobdellovibrionaceae bacterium]
MSAPDIAQVLGKTTALSEEQIAAILQNPALSRPAPIGKVLALKEYASNEEVVSELARELGIDFIREIPVGEISGDMVRDIPINYAKQNALLPWKEEGENILVLTSNPINLKAFDDLQALRGKRVRIILTTHMKLQDAINRVYEKSTAALSGLEGIEEEDYDLDDPIIDLLEAGEDDAPVIKLVNSLLFRAVKEKASDIHIEPYEKDMTVRFRIDGVLYDIFKPPKKLQNSIISRIKVMGNLNIAERRLPQDGRIPLKVGGKDIDIRLSTVPTAFGERVVMRLQDRSNVVLELDQLGFSDASLHKLNDLLARTYGCLLYTS